MEDRLLSQPLDEIAIDICILKNEFRSFEWPNVYRCYI